VASALAQTRHNPDEETLRAAVGAFTAALQREGEPIERVVIRLKHVMAQAASALEDPRDPVQLHWLADQRELAVRYCIARYFEIQRAQASFPRPE
jgi:hypothetical protein